MIYLIGGSPRSGKTTFAKLLAQKLNCELISLDNLRKEEINRIGKELAEKKFVFEKIYKNDNDDFFQNYTPKEILDYEKKEAINFWSDIEKIIEENITKNSIIIEGVQLLPEFLEKYKNNPNIKILFFYKKDKGLIFEGFSKNKNEDDWLLNNTKNNTTLKKAAETYAFYGEYFEKETKKYGFESINTEKEFNKIITDKLSFYKK